MYTPIPGLALLKSFQPYAHPIHNTTADLQLDPETAHSARTLVTIGLACAFGQRSLKTLKPEMFDPAVRRHIAARLRNGLGCNRTHLVLNSCNLQLRRMNKESQHLDTGTTSARNDFYGSASFQVPDSSQLIDLYGTLSVGDNHYAYTALIEKPAHSAMILRNMRVV
ncbi:MAG: hypothetical protein Q4A31_04945 [Corynebacterium sp.]|nr:hypothetical protein [Corynebacterium sp.]